MPQLGHNELTQFFCKGGLEDKKWNIMHDWGLNTMADILTTTFSNAFFLTENVCISIKIYLKIT